MHKDYTALIAKTVGITGVVAHHLANRRFQEAERATIALPGQWCFWAVPLFIVVSGYLHALSRQRRPTSLGAFAVSRVRRLFLPYAAISLVYAIGYGLLCRSGFIEGTTGQPVSWYTHWFAALTLHGGIGEQLYFLPLLLAVSLAATMTLTAEGYRPRLVLFSAIALGLAGAFLPDLLRKIPGRAVWPWDRFALGVAFYLFGYLMSLCPRWRKGMMLGTSVAVSAAAVAGQGQTAQFIFSVALFAALLEISPRSRPLEAVGEASGTIFLYHTPFFLPVVLALIAAKAPAGWHVSLAFATWFLTLAMFTFVHQGLVKSRLKWLAY